MKNFFSRTWYFGLVVATVAAVTALSLMMTRPQAQAPAPGGSFYVAKAQVPSYWVWYQNLTPAASLTDFVVLTGSATKTVRVLRWVCLGTATAAGNTTLRANINNVADTGGTKVTTPTATEMDQNNIAPTATWAAYSANPTIPTQTTGAGTVSTAQLELLIAATTAAQAGVTVAYDSAASEAQPVVLRGIAQQFAINGAGLTQPAGASISCGINWTEAGG